MSTYLGTNRGRARLSLEPLKAIPVPADDATMLLLHGDGANGGVLFPDASKYARTATVGGGAVTSTAQMKFGSASMLFDGAGDYLLFPASADWRFATSRFTIDCWIRPAVVNAWQTIVALNKTTVNQRSFEFRISNAGRLQFAGNSDGVSDWFMAAESTNALTANVWQHVAVVRYESTWKLFINGAVEDTETSTKGLFASTSQLDIGSMNEGADQYFNGYIDELRVSHGVARWTDTFTPPTRPY